MKVLYERAVAYLNVDYTVDFTYALAIGTSPLLQDAIYEATKKVSMKNVWRSTNCTLYVSAKVVLSAWKKYVYK